MIMNSNSVEKKLTKKDLKQVFVQFRIACNLTLLITKGS